MSDSLKKQIENMFINNTSLFPNSIKIPNNDTNLANQLIQTIGNITYYNIV